MWAAGQSLGFFDAPHRRPWAWAAKLTKASFPLSGLPSKVPATFGVKNRPVPQSKLGKAFIDSSRFSGSLFLLFCAID